MVVGELAGPFVGELAVGDIPLVVKTDRRVLLVPYTAAPRHSTPRYSAYREEPERPLMRQKTTQHPLPKDKIIPYPVTGQRGGAAAVACISDWAARRSAGRTRYPSGCRENEACPILPIEGGHHGKMRSMAVQVD